MKVAACALLEPDVVLSCRDRYDAYTREAVKPVDRRCLVEPIRVAEAELRDTLTDVGNCR